MEVQKNVLKTEGYCGSAQMDARVSYSVCRHCYLDHVYDSIWDEHY